MQLTNYFPNSEITIVTETGTKFAQYTQNPNSKEDNDIVSIETNRDMGADAPTFSIVLTRKKHWDLWVKPNDIILIKMQRPPQKLSTVMIGLVDECTKITSIKEGKPQRLVRITGRSLAKSVLTFHTGLVRETEYVDEQIGMGYLSVLGMQASNTSCKVTLDFLWDSFIKKYIKYSWSNGKNLYDYYGCSFTNDDKLELYSTQTIENFTGSLWSLLKEVGEAPFFELYHEVIDDKETLICRPTPFNKENWQILTAHVVDDSLLVDEQISRTDSETYTLYSIGSKCVTSDILDAWNSSFLKPLWHEKYAEKYGIRRLNVSTIYVSEELDQEGSFVYEEKRKDIFNWNIKNPDMFNGLIMVMGDTRYKVGNRLLLNSTEHGINLEFYIKSVAHKFDYSGSWVTILGVTRGITQAERFTSPWGEYKNFTNYLGKEGRYESNSPIAGSVMGGSPEILRVLEKARSLIGKPKYDMGAYSPETMFDCSSFTHYVFKTIVDINIGRTTFDQELYGDNVKAIADLRIGDLVMFKGTYDTGRGSNASSHVGIYSGNNKFIHCSSGKNTVVESELTGYWVDHYKCGRRVIKWTTTSNNTNQTTQVGTANAQRMNAVFGGVLMGKADKFISYGKTYGVDPLLAGAISCHETGNGTSKMARTQNNVGGMMKASGGGMSFSSIDAGIEAMIKNLKNLYIDYGLTTIEQIQKKYAPVGAANDPTALNQHWVSGVTSWRDALNSGKK